MIIWGFNNGERSKQCGRARDGVFFQFVMGFLNSKFNSDTLIRLSLAWFMYNIYGKLKYTDTSLDALLARFCFHVSQT